MPLRLGQSVPDFVLPDLDGRLRALSEFSRARTTTIIFFPFAFSGVCDKEACSFRDAFSRFSNFGSQIVGVSVDSVFTLKAFSQTYNLPFPLLSDFNKKVARLYCVLQDRWVGHDYRGVAKRSVFVVDGKGILRYKWVTETPDKEPPYEEVMRAVAKLQ